jgi:hypothetical protein
VTGRDLHDECIGGVVGQRKPTTIEAIEGAARSG